MNPGRDRNDVFNEALDDLARQGQNGPYSVKIIKAWLKCYENLYRQHVDHKDPCFGVKIFTCEYTPFNRFWEYYEKFLDLIRMHSHELYMGRQLREYRNIQHNDTLVFKLLEENADLCMHDLYLFQTDTEKAGSVNGLIRYYMHGDEYFCIKRSDFKHIITFKRLFKKLWYGDLYKPENDKNLESQIKYLL